MLCGRNACREFLQWLGEWALFLRGVSNVLRLRGEFLAAIADVNRFVEQQIPEINDMLKKSNAGAIMFGRPIEVPAAVR